MEKITLDKKLGEMRITQIEELTTRTRAGYMYWLNGGEIEIDMHCKLDLEKTKENCGLHFDMKSNSVNPERLIISYRHRNSYFTKEPRIVSMIEAIKKAYREENYSSSSSLSESSLPSGTSSE
jgi:hypothetical protein